MLCNLLLCFTVKFGEHCLRPIFPSRSTGFKGRERKPHNFVLCNGSEHGYLPWMGHVDALPSSNSSRLYPLRTIDETCLRTLHEKLHCRQRMEIWYSQTVLSSHYTLLEQALIRRTQNPDDLYTVLDMPHWQGKQGRSWRTPHFDTPAVSCSEHGYNEALYARRKSI